MPGKDIKGLSSPPTFGGHRRPFYGLRICLSRHGYYAVLITRISIQITAKHNIYYKDTDDYSLGDTSTHWKTTPQSKKERYIQKRTLPPKSLGTPSRCQRCRIFYGNHTIRFSLQNSPTETGAFLHVFSVSNPILGKFTLILVEYSLKRVKSPETSCFGDDFH